MDQKGYHQTLSLTSNSLQSSEIDLCNSGCNPPPRSFDEIVEKDWSQGFKRDKEDGYSIDLNQTISGSDERVVSDVEMQESPDDLSQNPTPEKKRKFQ